MRRGVQLACDLAGNRAKRILLIIFGKRCANRLGPQAKAVFSDGAVLTTLRSSLWLTSVCFALTELHKCLLRVAPNFAAVLLSIGPRRRARPVSIQQGQCFFGMVPCQIFLAVGQVSIRQATFRIGRVRVRKQVEF